MDGLTEAIGFISQAPMNSYAGRLNQKTDREREQKVAEEVQEDNLESEIKIDIDF